MPTPILMPAFSATMTQGKIVRWLKRQGDSVRRGEVVAEIESDKAIVEIEATEDGVLATIVAGDGASVGIGQPIAFVQNLPRTNP